MQLRLWEGRADSKGSSEIGFRFSLWSQHKTQEYLPELCWSNLLPLSSDRQDRGQTTVKKQLDPQRLELPLPPLAQTQVFGSVVGLGRSRPQLHQHREGTGEKRMGREPETGTPLSTHTSTCFPMLRH